MTAPFRRGELFGTGAGVPLAIGLNMTTAPDVAPVWIDHECDLCLRVDASAGTACDDVEFEFQSNPSSADPAGAAPPPGAAGWLTDPISFGITAEGIRRQTDGVYRMEGVGPERFFVRLHHEMWYRMRARRIGGGVDTTLLVTGEVRSPLGLEQSHAVPMSLIVPPFVPYDGGHQALNIAAAAVLSAQLVVGERYHIKAEAPCYWVTGDVAVVATAADYYLFAGETVEVEIQDAAHSYISVIRQLTDAAGGFHISRAS